MKETCLLSHAPLLGMVVYYLQEHKGIWCREWAARPNRPGSDLCLLLSFQLCNLLQDLPQFFEVIFPIYEIETHRIFYED